jgi:hypothetical protein
MTHSKNIMDMEWDVAVLELLESELRVEINW